MTKVNKSWMAALVAGVLLGALTGVGWARPSDRPQAAEITRKVTLPAGNFIPDKDDWDYGKFEGGAYVLCTSGTCGFTAPVPFPCLPSVTVERITLHVNDGNPSFPAGATLYRAAPSKGAVRALGVVYSPAGTSDGLQNYSSNSINKVVWPSQGAYIRLYISGTDIIVYGVTVEYHRNI